MAIAFGMVARAEDRPEVIRVHLPADRVTNWFPAGTPLRTLKPDEFEALFESARRGAALSALPSGPRLVRAHHHVHWSDGMLIGGSELVVESTQDGPGHLELVPWTPIVTPDGRDSQPIGTLPSGTPVLRLKSKGIGGGGGSSVVSLSWKLRALPGTEGRSFTLGLPGNETSVTTLELPRGWAPLGTRGFRRGPRPASRSGYESWQFYGRPGSITLRLARPEDRGPHPEAQVWVSGPSEVRLGPDAGSPPPPEGELANWTTEWLVQSNGRGSLTFSARLDPGLELLKVSGPEVREFRVQRESDGTLVVVTLTGRSEQPTRVRFAAHAGIPIDGTWRIPAMAPLDAIWTGGTTTVLLDPQHVIRECRERAGVRTPVVSRLGESTADARDALVFEAHSPESVAVLVLQQPRLERPCKVQGRLRLGASGPPELECQIEGLDAMGSSAGVQLEISPAWTPERVSWKGGDESLPWQATLLPDGSTRLQVFLSRTEATESQRALLIAARSKEAGGRGSLVLPRIRPIGVTILDETWLATVDDSLALHPTKATGLSWFAPPRAEALQPLSTTLSERGRIGLAWRWNLENAQGTVELERLDRGARMEVRTVGLVDRGGAQLEVRGEILVRPGTGGMPRIPVVVGGAQGLPSDWSFRLDAAGPELAKAPFDAEARARWELRPEARGYELSLPRASADGTQRIHFRGRLPLGRQGGIPLLSAPGMLLPRGIVLIRVPTGIHSHATGQDLRRLEPTLAERLAAAWSISDPSRATVTDEAFSNAELAHAFTYTEPNVELQLRTEELKAAGGETLIREASLTTQVDRSGKSLNRLRLLAQGGSSPSLGLTPPGGVRILRVLVDGTAAEPSVEQSRILIPLPAPAAGPRSWSIELVFEHEGRPLAAGSVVQPVLAASDLPCLAFSWELITPPQWQAVTRRSGLTACDPSATESWPLGRLGIPTARERNSQVVDPAPGGETLRRLDTGLGQVNADELTFGELFNRWDTPATPLVVDRLALSTLGYGPRSPCLPVGVGLAGQSPSLLTLSQYGLRALALDSTLLITSREEVSRGVPAEAWGPAVGEAQRWGSDRTDRFLGATRWNGEATPREVPSGSTSDALRAPPGWSSMRFTTAGWPGPASGALLDDPRARWLPGWLVAAACLAGILWHRGSTSRRALLLPLAGIALALVLELWLGQRVGSVSAGLFLGSLLGLVCQIVGRLPASFRTLLARPGRQVTRRSSSSRPILGRAIAFLPLLFLAGRDHAEAVRIPEGEGPSERRIPVLIPYDGAYDPAVAPSQYVVRLSDAQRLQQLAAYRAPSADPPLILLQATHRLSWDGPDQVAIASELLVHSESSAPSSWKVPISRSRDISATVDGQAVPVFIEPGGERAEIPVPAQGSHRILIRRAATPSPTGKAESLSFPVNPGTSAWLIAEPHPEGFPLRAVNARGTVKTSDDRSVSAELGPVDSVELQWGAPRPPESAPSSPPAIVDSVQLWDIEPAGDRIRLRLTYRGSAALSTLRFRTDPGLVPRKLDIPGLVSTSWEGPPDRTTWTMTLDPPLAQPAVIELELWRSLSSSSAPGPDRPARTAREPGESLRRLPRIEPLDVERGRGLLGVRRPGHWTGRQDPIPGSEPLSDESFVKTWGPLPDDRLTLAGTTRFARGDRPEFRTGPAESRWKVRPSLQLSIDQGRVDLVFEAELGDSGDTPDELTLGVPEALVVTGIRSEGLTDWSRVGPAEILVRFDRPVSRSSRRLRLSGYIPIVTDPLQPGATTLKLPTPWVAIARMDAQPGLLQVSSSAGVELERAPGAAMISTARSTEPTGAAAPAESVTRRTYRIVDPNALGTLRWNTPPPQVNVYIESQLMLHPDFAEWTAVLDYDILGGSLDSLPVRIPTAWAPKAQGELVGGGGDFKTSEFGPLTFWRVVLDRPAWGHRRLVIRSSMPLTPGQEIQHPEIRPLGLGRVDIYLRLVTMAGTSPNTEGSNSIKEVLDAGRFADPDFWAIPGTRGRVFHVARDNWSLKLQIPSSAGDPGPRASASASARVASADLNLTVLDDESLIGRAIYDTQAGNGRFFMAAPPRNSRLLWATVDQVPSRPFTAEDGRWHVPLPEGLPHRVCLYWSGPLDSAAARGAPGRPSDRSEWTLELPAVGSGPVPTLVTIRAAGDLAVQPSLSELEPISTAQLELVRANRISRQLNDFLGQMDRRSGRERERVISLVIAHELAIRGAERSLRQSTGRGEVAFRDRADRELEVVRSARKVFVDGLRGAAMDDELQAALSYLGESAATNRSSTLAVAAQPSPDRIRGVGKPICLQGVATGLDQGTTTIGLARQAVPQDELSPERARAILTLGLIAALILLVVFRPDRLGTLLLSFALSVGLLFSVGGPFALISGLGAVAVWLLLTPPPRPAPASTGATIQAA